MEREAWKPNPDHHHHHHHHHHQVSSPACPRCGSSNTKFCYYNNYSLTQPRYFCKGCRRYWTRGGSLRNVPVGGGCRKTRRGKSIRVSTNHAIRGTGPNASLFSSAPSSTSTGGTNTNSSIDLAAVYANFVNDYNKLPSNQILLPHQQYFQDLQISPQNLPPSYFFDSMYLCGMDKPGDQTIRGNDGSLNFTSNSNVMSSTMTNSLNLQGEDLDVSRGLLWPSIDEISPADIVEAEGRISSDVLNGSIVNPFGEFSNLEAMFRF